MADAVTILNSAEAAALLGIKQSTLRIWRCEGRGPCYVKLGRSKQSGVAYLESAVLAWRDARTFTSTSDATVNHPGNA